MTIENFAEPYPRYTVIALKDGHLIMKQNMTITQSNAWARTYVRRGFICGMYREHRGGTDGEISLIPVRFDGSDV